MTIIQSIILGAIEGVTEFLPISSTAHLIVAQKLMGLADVSLFFDTVVQLGALLALIIYFYKKILSYVQESVSYMQYHLSHPKAGVDVSTIPTGISMLVATLPVLVVGFLFRKRIEVFHNSLPLIAFMSIAVALLLFLAERMAKHASAKKVGAKHIVSMGVGQVLALIPGTSRSGIVIASGIFSGLDFSQAVEFSFLLSIPALGVAGLYELLSAIKTHPSSDVLLMTMIATVVSCLSALGVIHGLLQWVKKHGFGPFIIYRILFGLAILMLWR